MQSYNWDWQALWNASTMRSNYLDHDTRSRQLFETQGGRKSFMFSHRLSASPLLKLPALKQLARFYTKHSLRYHLESGPVTVDRKWSARPKNLILCDAIDQIEGNDSLILLNRADNEPEYCTLLNDFLEEIRALLGPELFSKYHEPICTLVIASPNRITPYHMDKSINFLLQTQGTKDFYVFDGTDRSILTVRELELFWGAGNRSAAEYQAVKQSSAMKCDLGPGRGVHLPVAFPHWARNGGDVSIAVSINLRLRQNLEKDVFHVNHQLRRIGLRPREPGRSQLLDITKSVALRTIGSTLRKLRSAI